MTRSTCYLATLLALFILKPAAHATFHEMQIEQVIGGVNGDTTVQAIQLRTRAPGQTVVSAGKLVVFDAAGLNPITVLDLTTNVTNGAIGAHVLIASANFPSHTTPAAVPDFTMANTIPASYLAAGSLVWESDSGTINWRLSWGGAAYTGSNSGSTTNDIDGNFGPPFGSALPSSGLTALQFKGAATALSTNNAADYLVTSSAAIFTNNAGASFTVNGGALSTITLKVTDANASEVPATDTGKARVTVTPASATDLTVLYSVGGTASNGRDYKKLSGHLAIRAGASTANLVVQPIDDTIAESDETVILTLLPDSHYTVGSPNGGTITIHSNE
jgi:hypothetical protein